ncbi:MAG TPA: glycosyltransferase family 2 protein [Acidobacteriota bacterium]|nr:glycosyltransferase family 2 protein [Acidobacteriota bacterium]
MTQRAGQPLISVVIPNHNGAAHLETCLSSLLRCTYPRFELVFVDNASTDASMEIVARVAPEAVHLRADRNLGFAGGVNLGIQSSHGDWIAVLNNDTEVAPDWLEECVRAMERHPEADFLACRILDFVDRNRIFSAGDCFLRAGIGYRRGQELEDRPDYREETEIFAACGCAALYRKSVLGEIGGFDGRFFAYLEDVDLALRLQAAGHRGWYVPNAVVYHLGAATSGGEFSSLAVRLRTRNSILLLSKSLPARVLWRSCLRIAAAQVSWLVRTCAHGKGWSYLRGFAGSIPLLAAMMKDRRRLRAQWHTSGDSLWRAILRSEAMARKDFMPPVPEGASTFLKWYFRLE